ncbi:hypothetical protein [Streptomyces sp. NPDC055607]
MDITFGPILLDAEAGAQLRPQFDKVLGTYTVELWREGEIAAVHGDSGEFFETAAAVTDSLPGFLDEHGARRLTDVESYELYGGLLRLKGGTGYELLIRQDARRS